MEQSKAKYTYGKGEYVGSIEVANTTKLQITSLHLFASALGYMYLEENTANGGTFMQIPLFDEDGKRLKQDKALVSSATMIKWHNTGFMPPVHHGFDIEIINQSKVLGFELEKMINAVEAKLVKRVYLQPKGHGKHKVLQTQRHVIEFV